MMTLEQVEAAGGYAIIYADPPWGYDNGGRGAAENHYDTMSADAIEKLPIRRLASDGACLFMWATWPFLQEAMILGSAWSFTYKTCAFVWVKHHEKSGKKCVGGGFWTRANTEFCLLFTRGKCPRRVDATVRQLIESEEVLQAPRSKHSAKPREARYRIEKLMGDSPRIELFARERAEGWDAWGEEAPGGSDVKID